jgi:high affinity cGMP-specific 3',5'-cyclic phosphodiesterase 9
MKILMKISDISNDARPLNVSQSWLDCLLIEFFNQGDHEKLNGLPISPLMDRNTYSKAHSQVNFISFVVLPLVEPLCKLFPQLMVSLFLILLFDFQK